MYNQEEAKGDINYYKIFNVGFYLCMFCFVVGIIIILIDYKTEKHDEKVMDEYIKK